MQANLIVDQNDLCRTFPLIPPAPAQIQIRAAHAQV
jgi:hypothetical protein